MSGHAQSFGPVQHSYRKGSHGCEAFKLRAGAIVRAIVRHHQLRWQARLSQDAGPLRLKVSGPVEGGHRHIY